MGTISTSTGLISGIDYGALIETYLATQYQGMVRLQNRISILQAQKTALLDINARLLNFKSAASSFRTNQVFQSALATSSDSEVLTATANTTAQPGTFQFIVKQLVTTSQQVSKGYASSDESPLGLDSISFEFGNGKLTRDMTLEDLNGGQGVDRGEIIITDRSGASGTVDLTDVTALSEVLERINDTDGISVTASVEGDHLVITDSSGESGTLEVENGSGDTTATDLGIAGTAAGAVLTGSDINCVGSTTALTSLNDGNGVLIRNNVADLEVTSRDGTTFTVDFGRVDADITADTLLEDLNNGDGVTLSDDEENPDIKFVDRDGTEYEVDLTDITTVGGLITQVSSQTEGRIAISITDGEKLTVTDTVGGIGNLKVQGAGDNGTDTAEDLGILNETGVASDSFDGEVIPNTIQDPAASTVADIIDRINNAEGNEGRVVASIAANGVSLKIEDMTGMTTSNLIVASTATNPDAASDLGIEADTASATYTGDRLIAGLNSVLVDSLNGGSGLGGATTVSISDRDGNSLEVNDLDTYDSLSEIVDALNEEAGLAGVQVTVSLNSTSTGLLVTDTSGGAGNLTITGDGATALGIAADVAADTVAGSNLQLQYVSNAKRLSEMNYGRGVSTGSFRVTDGLGVTATVTIGGDEETVYDVIAEINSKGLAVTARVNDNGDGIILEEDTEALGGEEPFVAIEVEAVSGTTAADLNILGESAEVSGASIDGSYERVVDLDTSDSLEEVIEKINDEDIPVSAALLNTGTGGAPYRLNLTSAISGRVGEMIIDTGGVDIGLSVLSEGQDAKVFFGAENPEDGFLVTSPTNTLDGVLQGVDIDLLDTSEDAVALTIARDVASITEAVSQLVTTFNDVIGRIDQYDYYDSDTEERGVLLGDPTAATIRDAIYRIATGRALNVDTSYQYLYEIGIGINSNGELTFDAAAFGEAYENDPEATENLLAAYDVTTSSTTEVGEGITTDEAETTYNSLGIANLFDRLLDQLTDSMDGTVTLADEAYQDQIDLLSSRIEYIDERVETRRAQLSREFTNLETILAQLQTQSLALASLALLSSSRTTSSQSSLY